MIREPNLMLSLRFSAYEVTDKLTDQARLIRNALLG